MNVNELLDTIEDTLEESAGMPLSGGKRIVDVEQIRDYLDEIRQNLPVELRQAQSIVSDRAQLIESANAQAQAIVKKASAKRLGNAYGCETLPETGSRYQIQFAIVKDQATLYLDTSGEGLYKRGYRARNMGAPLKETLAAALVTLSFALMFMLPLLPVHAQLALIALSAIGFDLGLQSSLVAHQNLVYGLEPQARGRLNALLFTVVFIGMSLGSVLGSKLYVLAGWNGVVTLAVITGALALAIRLLENARILAAERSAS